MTLRDWLGATRPKTLSAGVAPVILGSGLGALALGEDGGLHWGVAAACLVGALLIQIGSNFANDAFDGLRGSDGPDRLGPQRAVASGRISPRAMLIATALVLLLALIPGLWLASIAGWPLLALGLVSLVCAVAYTGGPFPLAYHGLGDLFVLLFFGLFAALGSAWVQAPELASWPPEWWAFAIGLGLQATVIIAVNNQRDRSQDALNQKRTLAVRLGAHAHRWYISLLHLGAIAAFAAGLRLAEAAWWPLLIIAPIAIAHALWLWRRDGKALNPALGAAAGLELLSALLILVSLHA
ncbi:MAG: 1,4-dihydroxy-2-naphthoate octaprenyltransferase [Planctomycetota bacterium]|nr:MAG: 1,4-dihydroxy-2-naphthoate octaprenyltransferase [Planctomycetota bacterium]